VGGDSGSGERLRKQKTTVPNRRQTWRDRKTTEYMDSGTKGLKQENIGYEKPVRIGKRWGGFRHYRGRSFLELPVIHRKKKTSLSPIHASASRLEKRLKKTADGGKVKTILGPGGNCDP